MATPNPFNEFDAMAAPTTKAALAKRAKERHKRITRAVVLILAVLAGKRLTPELSRAVLRPRRCDNLPHNGVAAKRSRLERIVSALKPAVC